MVNYIWIPSIGCAHGNVIYSWEPVWIYLRTCDNSLQAVDCNAQFSEIFQSKNFGQMNNYEKNNFLSVHIILRLCVTNVTTILP